MRKGFTLIELLVVIVIIGILVAIALPNFIRIKDKAKEAEVKQNLHAIQLALERYSVDQEANLYPLLIMGGDWTDSYVVWQSWIDGQGIVTGDITNPDRRADWRAAGQDVGDSLVMEAYLPSYPGNPFIKAKTDTLLPIIQHMPPSGYGQNGAPYDRIVGGRESNKMWECFGPVWTAPSQTTVGDIYVHHIYDNPKYSRSDIQKNPASWSDPSGNKDLVGNFSYWPRGSAENGAGWAWQGAPEPQGYTLAGYGALRTAGQDVYNRNGNYKGRYRTEGCSLSCRPTNFFGGIPCLCNSGNPPTRAQNDGGSDTVPDGVVITLDSGVDKKSARTDGESTQVN